MNLHANLQYPLLKYLAEELTGRFYQNELTCLNRMLILYHNRYIFSIYDDAEGYLDDYEKHLEKPMNFWYLTAFKRQRIRLVRKRMCFILKNNRTVFEGLLARKDYSCREAKQQTVLKIYHWLEKLPDDTESSSGIDLNQWKQELKTALAPLFSTSAHATGKTVKKPIYEHFYQVLTGADQKEKQQKFQRLLTILISEHWIAKTETDGVYQFRNTGRGARLQLAALYYVLNKQGHIMKELMATQIAGLFNSWLSHQISQESFVKAFQTEQQDAFNCSAWQPRYKYVQDCSLLIQYL